MSQPDFEHQQDQGSLQHDAEHAKPHKKVSVMGYLSILFAAAFLLLLMSYLQQQRNNEEYMSSLKESVSAVQSIENLIEEKEQLTTQVEELQARNAQLQQALGQAEDDAGRYKTDCAALNKQIEAMDYLRRVQELYAIQYYRHARELITAFQSAGLEPYLPTESHVTGEPSPAAAYQEIYSTLYPDPDAAD